MPPCPAPITHWTSRTRGSQEEGVRTLCWGVRGDEEACVQLGALKVKLSHPKSTVVEVSLVGEGLLILFLRHGKLILNLRYDILHLRMSRDSGSRGWIAHYLEQGKERGFPKTPFKRHRGPETVPGCRCQACEPTVAGVEVAHRLAGFRG